MRRRRSSAPGAGGAVAAAMLAEAGLDVVVLEAGDHYNRDNYPSEPLDGDRRSLPRRRADDRRGRPADPRPGRAGPSGGTTVINSGTCFRAPDAVLEDWRARYGVDWAGELGPDYAEAEEILRVTPLDPERMGRNGQLAMEGARGARRQRRADLAATPATACSAAPAPSAAGSTPSAAMHVCYLPRAVAAGARIRAGVAGTTGPGRGRARGRASRCSTGAAASGNGHRRPTRSAPGARRSSPAAPSGRPSCCCAPASAAARSAVTSTSTRPAGSAPATRRRCAAGTGVMQSYYVDRVGAAAGSCSRRPSRRSPSAAPGCSARAPRISGRARLRPRRLDRRPPLRPLLRPGRPRRRRLAAGHLPADRRRRPTASPSASPARPRSTSRPAPARSIRTSPGSESCEPGQLAEFEATSLQAVGAAPRGLPPDGDGANGRRAGEGVCAADGAVHGTAGLYVADASLLPTSVGVNPMMTIIAFAKQVSRGIAQGAAG